MIPYMIGPKEPQNQKGTIIEHALEREQILETRARWDHIFTQPCSRDLPNET